MKAGVVKVISGGTTIKHSLVSAGKGDEAEKVCVDAMSVDVTEEEREGIMMAKEDKTTAGRCGPKYHSLYCQPRCQI